MALCVALAAAVCTTGLIVMDHLALRSFIANMEMSVLPYTTLTGVLGFVLSFRTSQAYERFWHGTQAAYEVTGGLYMAASSLMAFVHHGDSPPAHG